MSNNNNFDEDNVIDIDKKFDVKDFGKKGKNIIIAVIVVILVGTVLFKGLYIVQEGQNAVVLRFGQIESVKEAGLNFKIPFIDTVQMVDVRHTYNMEYGFRTARGGSESSQPEYMNDEGENTVIVNAADNNASIILLELIVQYKVADPIDYLFKVDDLEGTLRIALEDVIRNTYQTYTLDEARTSKSTIDAVILPALQSKIDSYKSGLKIVAVQTQNVKLLPAVQDAYQQKENANQYKKGKEEEAEKYENTIIPKANAEAIKLEEEAVGYEAEVKAEAKANIAQFNALYEEYKKNPQIVKEKYYVEAMNELIRNNDIVINQSKGDFNVFYNVDEKDQKIKEQINN